MSTLIKRTLLAVLVCAAATLSFLFYSVAVTFENWPWTQTETVSGQDAFGFRKGMTKSEARLHGIQLLQEERITRLAPLDFSLEKSRDTCTDRNASIHNPDCAKASDRWHARISDVNAWFIIEFEDGNLASIVRKDYRGPTE